MHKRKLSIDEQIEDLKSKNVKFEIYTVEEAKKYLYYNNYYFKVKSYARDFSQYSCVEKNNQYINLDFAYLVELSELDMYFRRLIVRLSLEIEHVIKVRFMKDIINNPNEDGYNIVKKYVDSDYSVLLELYSHNDKSATKGLIEKIKANEDKVLELYFKTYNFSVWISLSFKYIFTSLIFSFVLTFITKSSISSFLSNI